MIVDELANWTAYANLIPGIATAFRFLLEKAGQDLPPGEYEIEGREVYALSMHSESAPIPGSPLEIHRRYADVQYLVSGREVMGWAPLRGLITRSEYDPQRDVAFYELPEEWCALDMKPGWFAIFLPNDPHMPGRYREAPGQIRKIVVKVRVDSGEGRS